MNNTTLPQIIQRFYTKPPTNSDIQSIQYDTEHILVFSFNNVLVS